MRVDGTGDAVQIPALALVVADFSELVVGPIIGNWESQITREPRRHIGDEGGTCVAGIDDTAADVARSVDAHTITASEGLSDSLEVRQDIAGHLVIGRIEVYSEVDMGGRDAKTLRRLTSGLGMSSAVCRGEMFQLRGVLLKNREEPHAALSDALELTRTDGLKVILGSQRRLARLRQITSHDFIPVCLQRRQPSVGNFEPSVTGHTRAIRITFRCQQAHPRGRINRARHSNGITLLERFHDIGERARPYEGRPAPRSHYTPKPCWRARPTTH